MFLPKFEKSQIVRVFLYYHDMIVKGSFVGIILDVKTYTPRGCSPHHIYRVMSFEDNRVHRAEQFAIEAFSEELQP